MKVFRKMFAFAVTVAAIAMATSAFAATAEYDATNKLVKVADTGMLEAEQGQATVAVLPVGFRGNDADIMYIDQDSADAIQQKLEDGLAVKAELVNPAEGYEVRVAGTSTAMQTINFNSIQVVGDVTNVTDQAITNAIGFKGSFQYNGGSKEVTLYFSDSKTGATNVPYTWNLGDAISSSNATIVFGLEIQADNGQELDGITVSFANGQ